MRAFAVAVLLLGLVGMGQSGWGAEGAVLDTMDDVGTFVAPKEKGKIESVEGKAGKAIKFSFDDACSGIFMMGKGFRGSAEWDKAAGFSFWVKGDGSDHLGGLQFVWNEDYATRYTLAFPIDSTEWKKITVAWIDLVPVLANGSQKLLDAQKGNPPSKLGGIWFGKWWFWKDYAAHSYTIDDIRLEPTIEVDTTDYTPKGAPLARVLEKLKAKQPITVVTIGDSLTDPAHWSNRATNWPASFKAAVKEKFGVDATIINPAMGGTTLRQNIVILPRWLKQNSAPDLVTVFIGGNDFDSKVTPEGFQEGMLDAVDRIRRGTKGKSDVLIMTTAPSLKWWDTIGPLAEGCRAAAKAKNTGLADVFAAFHEAGKEKPERLFAAVNGAPDVHLAAPGQDLVAKTVITAIESGGK